MVENKINIAKRPVPHVRQAMKRGDSINGGAPAIEDAAFWQPPSELRGPTLYHAPALFDLIARLKPRVIVMISDEGTLLTELVATALERAQLDAEVWDLVDATPKMPVPQSSLVARKVNAPSRPRFFAAKSVDLLIVDRTYDSDLMVELRKEWPTQLSHRAVVCLHGTAKLDDMDFLHEIRRSYPVRSFHRGEGLEMVLFGPKARATFGATPHADPDRKLLLDRLGEACHHRAEITRLVKVERSLTEVKQDRDRQAATVENLYESQQAEMRRAATVTVDLHEIDRFLGQLSWLMRRNRITTEDVAAVEEAVPEDHSLRAEGLRAIMFKLSNIAELENRVDAYAQEIQTLNDRTRSQQATIDRQAADLDRSHMVANDLQSTIDRQTSELATLTGKAVGLQDRISERDRRIAELDKQKATLEVKIKDLGATLSQLKARNEELLRSTSWRISAPVRVIGRLVKRQNG